MSHDQVLEGIDDLPWTELSSCHDAAPVPELFRQVAEGNRRSLVAADQILQIVWHQGSLFEATIPAARYMADLAASDLRLDVRALLVGYLLLFGHGTTFVEPSGGRSYLDPAEFAERVAAEWLVVDEVKRIVANATDDLLRQLETAPSEVREALLGLAHLGSQPLPEDTLELLRTTVAEVPPNKRSAAQLVLDHLEANPIRLDLVEKEWRDLSDGEELLEHARRGEFTDENWTTLISQMAGTLCTTPLDCDGLWARAQLFGDGDLLSVDEDSGPSAAGRHCVRRTDDGAWRVFYDDGGEVRFEAVHDAETAACEHVWSRLRASPQRWDADAHRRQQEAMAAALEERGHRPPTPEQQMQVERSGERVAALRGLVGITMLRRVRGSETDTFDAGAVGSFVLEATSGRFGDPDALMPLLEYWMVAVHADEACDSELRLASRLAHQALIPTLPDDRNRPTIRAATASERRRAAETKMRQWLVGRGALPPE